MYTLNDFFSLKTMQTNHSKHIRLDDVELHELQEYTYSLYDGTQRSLVQFLQLTIFESQPKFVTF